jgi:hypothetical protein
MLSCNSFFLDSFHVADVQAVELPPDMKEKHARRLKVAVSFTFSIPCFHVILSSKT